MRPCSDQLVHTETHWNMQPFLYLTLLCHCKCMQAGDVCDFKTVGWGKRIYSVYFGWTTRLGGHLSPSSPSFTSSSAPHFSPLSCFSTVVRQPLHSLFCPLPPFAWLLFHPHCSLIFITPCVPSLLRCLISLTFPPPLTSLHFSPVSAPLSLLWPQCEA